MGDGLLFLHAWPLDAAMWERQAGPLRGVLPLLAPSYPGFGGIAPAGNVLTMDAAADACADLASKEGMERFVVCGLSMGGYVAFSMWRRHRDRVLGMVLANTRAAADDEPSARGRLALADRLSLEGSAFLVRDPPQLLAPNADPGVRAEVRAMMEAQPARAIAAAARGMAGRPDSTPDLPEIRIPVLVVTSTEDALIPPDLSSRMADAIHGARLATIEGAGHLSNMERPDEFLSLLREHLAVCGLPAGEQ